MSSQRAPDASPVQRSGRVAIVGRPNVGKSTLLNRLVGTKVSITSSKPQTTRQRMTGIVTHGAAQFVFVDTPGYQTEHPSALNRAMNRSVAATMEGVEAAVWVVEALRYDGRDEQVGRLLPPEIPVVLAINKTDAVKDRASLLPFISRLSGEREFVAIVPVSAAKGWQTSELLEALARLMPEGPHLHDADDITTVQERVLAAELLREKVIRSLGDELPYATMIEIDHFKQEGAMRRIHASIVVDKEGQKPIVIGKGGKTLKSIASRARREMEALFGGKVFLEVWVKVRKGWADSEAVLRRLDVEG